MLLEGAKNSTEDEIRAILNLDNVPKDQIHLFMRKQLDAYNDKQRNVTIEVANLLYASRRFSINNAYKAFLKSNYDAESDNVNFAADSQNIMRRVNRFVRRKTHDNIKEALKSPPGPKTVSLLLNTVYFKGLWQKKFEVDSTHKGKFYNEDKSEVNIDFMYKGDSEYNCHDNRNVRSVELPYHGNFSLYLLVPQQRYGLQSYISSLSSAQLETLIAAMRSRRVEVSIPKFNLEHEVKLEDVLHRMGLNATMGDDADFSGMSELPVSLAYAFHKAAFAVDETGTVASGFTELGLGSRLNTAMKVIANHPFAFLLRDKTSGVNVFMGIINKF
ncbi:uncharacterized protein B4U79_08349 [Dinothrombium tinctorium]|uniref:Serpin domain-containing protein n=1 Tax=Dinothrombium tinctorium TaxID=1965070 RepID=A0A3S5WGZ4_9ACAR|nr:uncharacterized protein B4U79_01996 [Dinothrombium tinctorium]RWS13721.1 uncharacterized protein B4U79_08349 [Dinothrombium tinctorium]